MQYQFKKAIQSNLTIYSSIHIRTLTFGENFYNGQTYSNQLIWSLTIAFKYHFQIDWKSIVVNQSQYNPRARRQTIDITWNGTFVFEPVNLFSLSACFAMLWRKTMCFMVRSSSESILHCCSYHNLFSHIKWIRTI